MVFFGSLSDWKAELISPSASSSGWVAISGIWTLGCLMSWSLCVFRNGSAAPWRMDVIRARCCVVYLVRLWRRRSFPTALTDLSSSICQVQKLMSTASTECRTSCDFIRKAALNEDLRMSASLGGADTSSASLTFINSRPWCGIL